ncbi:amidohydrolase family protein [Allosphingosinicella humi]
MIKSAFNRLALAGSVALLALGIAAPAAAEDLVIENVTLVDGTGQPKQAGMTVGVKDGRFTVIAPTASAPKMSGRKIDGTGKYLMPGMMDVHIHLRGGRGDGIDRNAGLTALASYLYSGVTTVYDAGNNASFILGLRADEHAGRILSPRILATGNLITYPGSHGSGMAIEVDSWPQAKEKLDKHIAEQKPDIVKLTYDEHGWGSRPMISLLPKELMQEIILYYNQHGIRTTVHTSSELRATEAIFAGVDSLAHPVIQGPISKEFALLMGAKKVPMATTLTIGEGYSRLVEHPEFLDQPLYRASLSASEIAELRTKTAPEWKARSWTWWMKLMTPIAQQNMKEIHDAGGVIAVATDQSIGPAVHREMELLQAAGIPAADIVEIATLNGARHIGREKDLGSVEPGKIADAVLLSADPTADINNAKAIVLVMKDGVLVDEDKLPLAGGKQALRRAQR